MLILCNYNIFLLCQSYALSTANQNVIDGTASGIQIGGIYSHLGFSSMSKEIGFWLSKSCADGVLMSCLVKAML